MTRTLRATSSLQTTRKNWWKFSFVELSTYTTLANDRPVSLPVECLYVIDRVRVIWIIRVYEERYIESFSFSFSVSFHQWCFERIQNLWRIMYRYEARALSGYIGDDRLERTNSFDCFFLSLFSLWVTEERVREIFLCKWIEREVPASIFFPCERVRFEISQRGYSLLVCKCTCIDRR